MNRNITLSLIALLFCANLVNAAAQVLSAHEPLADLDSRTGSIQPTSQQTAIVSNLGAEARWNLFGTPQSLINHEGYLATGLGGDAVTVARTFIGANRDLFRLSDQGVADLELVSDSILTGSEGHAVLLRQRFGDLPAANDGMITVGVVGDKVAYVSSSIAGDQAAPAPATLTATVAWLNAASEIGLSVPAANITGERTENDWTVFDVAGFSHAQRARLVALPTFTQGVKAAYETIVLDVQGGKAIAYTSFVDASTGEVLVRHNRVQQLAGDLLAPTANTFSGSYTPTTCGTNGPFTAGPGVKSIDVIASATILANDITLQLLYGTTVKATFDSGTSPEAIHYEPGGDVAQGDYFVKVCPFDDNQIDPTSYNGSITFNDVTGVRAALTYTAKWKFFKANPNLDYSSTDTRIIGCWLKSLSGLSAEDSDCQFALSNLASRVPWDFDVNSSNPTFTTLGNNAKSAEAWTSPLTPGALQQQPFDLTRRYVFPWTNVWKTSKCDPSTLVPGGNDIFAATTNLFVMHNRMHDWSYFLGFTETAFNAQLNNFGLTSHTMENDPETGNVQAGALDGGTPSFLGRDNANQITLNDGIAPITNMYLWQPISAAFYPPCVDGDYDMSVIGHEFTHMISNRMVAGPDSGLDGFQAGSMGESWSDLSAVEYLTENSFVPTSDENPFSVGAYVTGNKTRGIRDYALDQNPLNYSDIGFDLTGPEVHADGEVWNAVNFEIRQALIAKYNATYPSTNTTLQKDCADGKLPADSCPGNRRWIQIMFDGWLLSPAAPSMLDARDSYLAADRMRFGGANQTELWRAFAKRGLGSGAFTNGTGDDEPIPSFASPKEKNAVVTFNATALNEGGIPVTAKIFVGKYEARVTPIADTDASTPLSNVANFAAGTYDFVAQAPGYGFYRFTKTFSAGKNTTVKISMPTNWASKTKGATVTASSTLPNPPDELTGLDEETNVAENVIDDTEATDWTGENQLALPQTITISLGAVKTIRQVNVSALLRPARTASGELFDAESQNRFTALRKFRLEGSTNGILFTAIFTSADDAFPGTQPRPVAPDLNLRTFTLPSAVSVKYLRLVALTNQCQGGPAYQGDQDNDPLNNSDCTTDAPSQGNRIRVAEVQAFQ